MNFLPDWSPDPAARRTRAAPHLAWEEDRRDGGRRKGRAGGSVRVERDKTQDEGDAAQSSPGTVRRNWTFIRRLL